MWTGSSKKKNGEKETPRRDLAKVDPGGPCGRKPTQIEHNFQAFGTGNLTRDSW